jgi:long-chain acyl-CoA synthetase
VRGPIVMMGYFGNEAETRAVIETDGWLHTGDIAYVDATGHFFIVDRRKDLIITAGYNVYPAESSGCWPGTPPSPWSRWGRCPTRSRGEIACAYVVRREGAEVTKAELIDFSRDQLAAYKRPRRVVFVESLPATSSGKIMRRKLAKSAGQAG